MAKKWFNSLDHSIQATITQDWLTLRHEIGVYFMNRAWVEKQRGIANRASYRDSGNEKETPSAYIMRKKSLLDLTFAYEDGELIVEIMNGAPHTWRTVIDTSTIFTYREFMIKIKYHEEMLSTMSRNSFSSSAHRDSDRSHHIWKSKHSHKDKLKRLQAKAHAVSTPQKPAYPKDDSNVSRKHTPESLNKRPCFHCGSGKHWDNECKYAKKNTKQARVHFSSIIDDELREQEEYEDLENLFGADSSDSSESESESTETSEQDFQ
jgi:hypothetical protein